MTAHLSWLEAGVVGAMQGIAELFPISSLGHSVLLPAWVGGSWQRDLNVGNPESPYLAFIVGLHVATAIALLIYFWRDGVRIITGLITSIGRREICTADQRLAWLLVLATIPVGLVGLVGEHFFRTHLGKPVPTAIFLIVNGVILLGIERLRRRDSNVDSDYVDERVSGPESDQRLAAQPVGKALFIGSLQIAALAPGISRSGVALVGGMLRGLSREDAARFSFLLATPVILAAGVLKLGDLAGPLGD
jgi:undecaprenyl-diphosphatase